MRRLLSQVMLDRLFRISVVIKGLDGLVEAISGVILLVVPLAAIKGQVESFLNDEIQEGKHAFIAQALLKLDHKVDVHVALFAAVYLVAHGLLKVGLAGALFARWWKLYPYAIGFLLVFIAYQGYLIGYNHSLVLFGLTLFDCLVVALTYAEWRRHRSIA